MKFLLYCFEWLTGLKINYHKSDMVVFGVDQEEQQRVANILNCKVGALPMQYLGLPISDRHLGANSFVGVVEKMRKKLAPWKGKLLSSGGRITLTNSVLSSIPSYIMGMFRLGEGIHHKMDTIRSQFFWRGANDKFKYHMVKWEQLCVPKDFGGLGIINTRTFNDAIILKWAWRLLVDREEDVCCQLLKTKYCRNRPFINNKGGSQF